MTNPPIIIKEPSTGRALRLFTRGTGPLVSVLLPTRSRPQHLYEAVGSCWLRQYDKGSTEYVFKIDDDDTQKYPVLDNKQEMTTEEMVDFIASGVPVQKIKSPRGRGYLDMHLWVNEMSKIARGDWLLLFNDDARMETKAWDMILASCVASDVWLGVDDICLLNCRTIGRPFVNEFPFVRRKVTEVLGHYSLNPHNDNWIYHVVKGVGCDFDCPICIHHMSDTINDSIRKETEAAYEITGKWLNSVEMVRKRLQDSLTLLDYIEEKQNEKVSV